MSLNIHWHEGLFLQPHHLQLLQHSQGERFAEERRLHGTHPFGVIRAELMEGALANFRVQFKTLQAIMPSGVVVNFPEGAFLPSMDIRQRFARGLKTFDIFLAVPLWQTGRANTIAAGQPTDTREKLIYRVKDDLSFPDENTGANEKPIQVRMVNARLIFEDEDRADLDVLPLMRIRQGVEDEEGLPKQDPEFAAPSMVLSASPVLYQLVNDLVNRADATRDELDRQLHAGGIGQDKKGELTCRLMVMGRFCGRLLSLLGQRAVSTYEIYLELRGFLAELAAFRPGQAVYAARPYEHLDPYPCFNELKSKILREIKPAGGAVLSVPFVRKGVDWNAPVTDEHLNRPNGYYLAVKSKVARGPLSEYITDGTRFKIMPASWAKRAVRGLELREESIVPLELPNQAGLYYYQVLTGENPVMWRAVRQDRSLCLVTQNPTVEIDSAEFTLYMTLPT